MQKCYISSILYGPFAQIRIDVETMTKVDVKPLHFTDPAYCPVSNYVWLELYDDSTWARSGNNAKYTN